MTITGIEPSLASLNITFGFEIFVLGEASKSGHIMILSASTFACVGHEFAVD
jgi:hypothetical protein